MLDATTAEEIRALVRDEMAKHGPLDPLYTFVVGAEAIPCSRRSLTRWLQAGGFVAQYSWQPPNVRVRMVPASELRWVRAQMFRARRRVTAP